MATSSCADLRLTMFCTAMCSYAELGRHGHVEASWRLPSWHKIGAETCRRASALPPVFLRDTQRYIERQEMRPLPADQGLPSPKTARRWRPLSR
jgi:hypothetical protein